MVTEIAEGKMRNVQKMHNSKSTKIEDQAMTELAEAGFSVKRHTCYFCYCKVDITDECRGCGEFICEDCWGDPPRGQHFVEEHRV